MAFLQARGFMCVGAGRERRGLHKKMVMKYNLGSQKCSYRAWTASKQPYICNIAIITGIHCITMTTYMPASRSAMLLPVCQFWPAGHNWRN